MASQVALSDRVVANVIAPKRKDNGTQSSEAMIKTITDTAVTSIMDPFD